MTCARGHPARSRRAAAKSRWRQTRPRDTEHQLISTLHRPRDDLKLDTRLFRLVTVFLLRPSRWQDTTGLRRQTLCLCAQRAWGHITNCGEKFAENASNLGVLLAGQVCLVTRVQPTRAMLRQEIGRAKARGEFLRLSIRTFGAPGESATIAEEAVVVKGRLSMSPNTMKDPWKIKCLRR